MSNAFKTALLLIAISLALIFLGGHFGGQKGMVAAVVIAGIMNSVAYFFSDRITLAMHGGKLARREDLPRVFEIVEGLTQHMGIPMPRVYLIEEDSPNAFATGRSPRHATVAVTRGLVKLMRHEEMKGVLAHELSHVKNRDVLISSVAALLAGAIILMARMGHYASLFGGSGRDERDRGGPLSEVFMLVLAPIAAMVIRLAVSRSREYIADASGAEMTGDPCGLARALEKLHRHSSRQPLLVPAATAHLFIVQPLVQDGLTSLFSTQPPVPKRLERLIGQPALWGARILKTCAPAAVRNGSAGSEKRFG
jgi:heat shock protein HtpX